MGQSMTHHHGEASPGSSIESPYDYESDIPELSTVLSTPLSLTPPESPRLSAITSPGLPPSPCSLNEGPVILPLRIKKPKDDSPKNDVITQRRISFYAAMKDRILPLLGDDPPFFELLGFISDREVTMQPRRVLSCQPRGLRGSLKPYQLDGLSFLLHLHDNGIGGILGDEMGLGKTLQTLSLFQYIKVNGGSYGDNQAPFLVVCPLSVLETWMSEISKWTPELVALKYHGSPSERGKAKKLLANKRKKGGRGLPDIVVTSYETLTSDATWFKRVFIWRYVVLDEGHRIKNFQAQRTLALGKIRADFKLVLTGTPVQNNLQELWSILHWLFPDVFVKSTITLFEEAFSLNDGVFDRYFFEHISEFLKVVMLRREKDSPGLGLTIPKKTEFILSVPLSSLQRWWYLKLLKGLNRQDVQTFNHTSAQVREDNRRYSQLCAVENGNTSEHDLADGTKADLTRKVKISQNVLMELRKCSIHPYLLEGAMPFPYKITPAVIADSGKFQVLFKLVGRFVTEGKKVIIFSGFEGALDFCEDLLVLLKKKIGDFKYVRLDGGTSRPRRTLSTYLFQNDDRYLVFLISIRAGGEGLNLISSSTVIFLDEDWNPQVMKQACSRVHRIGQKKPVEIYRLQSKGTVEDQMYRRLLKKAYMADRVIENVRSSDNGSPMAMSMATFQNVVHTAQSMDLRKNMADLLTDLDSSNSIGPGSCLVREVKDNAQTRDKITADEEEAWLRRSERVRTNVFNGRRIAKRTRTLSSFEEQLLADFRREDRRIGKERTVVIDGFDVSKDSLAQSEPLSPKRLSNGSQKSGTNGMFHESTCFVCKQYNTTDCDMCPRTFHWDCLGGKARPGRFSEGLTCPQHYCEKCGKTASQAGGLIFPCISYEFAFCEHCLTWDRTTFVEHNIAYSAMGYTPSNAFFIICTSCKRKDDRKRRASDGLACSTKRVRRK